MVAVDPVGPGSTDREELVGLMDMIRVTPELGGHQPVVGHFHVTRGEVKPGDYVWASRFMTGDRCCDGARKFVWIEAASWAEWDHDSTAWHRSNHRSLLRSFPDMFVEAEGEGLVSLHLPLDAEIPATLANILEGLKDHPVFDDVDLAKLSLELWEENWEDWGRRGFSRKVERRVREITGDDGFLMLQVDVDLDAFVRPLMEDGTVGFVPMGATGGYFEGLDEVADLVARELVDSGLV